MLNHSQRLLSSLISSGKLELIDDKRLYKCQFKALNVIYERKKLEVCFFNVCKRILK